MAQASLQMFALIVASALLPTATSSLHFNDTVFAVTVSSQVTGGSPETLCVQIHGPTEPVSLTISLGLEDSGTNFILEGNSTSTILQESVTHDYYHCLTFQAPTVSSAVVATMTVVLQGEIDSMSKKTKILISPISYLNIIQTDKPIYKPGQTVQFRIVSLTTGLVPVAREYTFVDIEDPKTNLIARWKDPAVVGGILDLSLPMSPEAAQGIYTIKASTKTPGEDISQTFEIKEYVLPKYEVKVHVPGVVTILDQEATLKICGKYTYGKPVLGSVKAVVCRKASQYYWYSDSKPDICKTYDVRTDREGCATQTLNVTQFALNKRMYDDHFEVEAEMEEYGTGVILKGSGQISFTSQIRTVTFKDVSAAYKPGIVFEGKVKVTGPDSSPVASEPVYLFVRSPQISENLTLTTDNKGMASFSLDTSLWKEGVSLLARSRQGEEDEPYVPNLRRPEYRSAHHSVTAFYSKSNSFIKLLLASRKLSCDLEASVRATYIIQGEELKSGQDALHFFYLVMTRGRIVQHGRLSVAVTAGTVNTGELSVSLQRVQDLAPFAQVVVYTVMPSGEAVADSQDFPIQRCLKNKVSLRFSSLQELPGEKTVLSVQAQPGSLCSVRAIDQSVLLLQAEQELTAGYVYSLLPVQKLSGYNYQVEDFDPYPCLLPPMPVPQPQPDVLPDVLPDLPPEPEAEMAPAGRVKRSFYFGPSNEKNDVYSIFKEIGMKIVTNSDVKKPHDCRQRLTGFNYDYDMVDSPPVPMAFNMMPQSAEDGMPNKHKEDTKETVRTYFPETWIWDLVPVGDSGVVTVEKTVPDTITKWAAGAFCTSSVGFGVSANIGLTAFQPFFVSLTLPYSVIRGEVFTLKATVFNYLSKCIMVKVALASSEQYSSRHCEGCQYSVCLCAEESRTFRWIITPTALGEVDLKVSAEALRTDQLCGNEVAAVPEKGRVDTVVRTLLVEAEGTPEAVTHNALLCPADGQVERNISLMLPEMFVAGSAKASVSVLGDLMGRALRNLDKLLAMPYGCGEQNMVLFAPNIYILNYLQSTGQLTQEIQDKATRFLEAGYQRELNYKHRDGSYSAFGQSDPSGNTWLTAFVMKSFGGARPYIFVDSKHIEDARRWLAGHQRPDGCISSVGKLFHNGMKGGVSDDVSLTAYITAGLLELDVNVTDPLVERCLICLKAAVAGRLDNLYNNLYLYTLLSYTFTLAGDQDTRSKLITLLHQHVNTEDGARHWQRVGSGAGSESGASSSRLDSLEVEMSSYVLLALLSGPPLPDFGLDYSSGIVRWLAQQQNAFGGFASTQDTVVALQALAKFGAATYSVEGATTVQVSSAGGLRREFRVEQANRLLYQEEELSEVPGEYTITARGRSCVLTQISMRYNVPPPPDFSAFHISANVMAKCNASRPQLILFVDVRYQGRREETNMVIINIKLLSGYILDKSFLKHLKSDSSVKRVDVEEGYINIYLDGLRKDKTKTFSVTIEEDIPVRNLKAAVVKVYDYYQTSDEAVSDYTSPCAESDSINKL